MITFNNNLFHLATDKTSYCFFINEHNHLEHAYYGARLQNPQEALGYPHHNIVKDGEVVEFNVVITGMTCWKDRIYTLAEKGMEVASTGLGDYRPTNVEMVDSDNNRATLFEYVSHEIVKGFVKSETMPCPNHNDDCDTLIVRVKDFYSDCEMEIYYSVYNNANVIVRRNKLINTSKGEITVNRLVSANLDIRNQNFDFLYLKGKRTNERHIVRQPLDLAVASIESRYGCSSHTFSPFFALCERNANDHFGETYGVQLMYSGNFLGEAVDDFNGNIRATIGISPYNLSYPLKPGESMDTPCAVLTYSDEGFNGMSINFNRFTNNHVIPQQFKQKPRPIVVNTWEAFVYDVSEENCAQIIDSAKDLGVDLFVIDDGWFGRRGWAETDGLGDWWENPQKFPNGLEAVVKKAKDCGLQFGIWIEPEMVNPLSDLLKEHPDWALGYKKGQLLTGRRQHSLDFSHPEVVDYLIKVTSDLIKRLDIRYIKMDMNRYIPELNSYHTEWGKIYYDYMVGLYRYMTAITTEFPHLLFENCASGGGRLDLGMCVYAPQTWVSDNIDPTQRAVMQYNATMYYPPSAMGCHVVDGPFSDTKKYTNFAYTVAKIGALGYENDMIKITEDLKELIREQIKDYHSDYDKLFYSDFYRLFNTGDSVAYNRVSYDKSYAEVIFVRLFKHAYAPLTYLKVKGLDPNANYKVNGKEVYSGDTLMKFGIPLARGDAEYTYAIYKLEKVN